jgi:uncharacterized protein
MKQQVLLIHGGETFDSYPEYLTYLKEKLIDSLDYFVKNSWRQTLQALLGENFEVIAPRMPNYQNAKYAEWKIWFEKIFPFVKGDVILIGVSLGGIFLVKYLSENKFPKTIKATFLIAPPFDTETQGESLADFILPGSLDLLTIQGGEVCLYQSKDDKVVPYKSVEKYKEKLPDAEINIFEDRGHFTQESFPELVEAIRKLA